MVRLVVIILVLAAMPSQANDAIDDLDSGFWEEFWATPCQEDLVAASAANALNFEVEAGYDPEKSVLVPRIFGTQHALCIDELIAISREIDWRWMAYAEKHFTTQLE